MSRRKGRYERRKTRREENRLRRAATVGGLHDVFGYDDMYKAGKKCCNGVRWKNSTQRFEMHLFSGTARRRRLLLERKWIPGAYVKRARRKIKAFRTKIQNGEMSYDDLWTSVNGMLAYFESYDDHNRVLRLRRLFYSIFGFSPERIENFRERGQKDEIRCA